MRALENDVARACLMNSVRNNNLVNERDLLDREGQWAYRPKSVKAPWINDSDFFFSQNKSSRVRKS